MTERPESRIADARSRAWTAKQRLGVGAVVGFVALLGLAWASHPGKATVPAGSGDSSTAGQSFSQSDDDFGGLDSFGGIAPSGAAAPQVQSGVS